MFILNQKFAKGIDDGYYMCKWKEPEPIFLCSSFSALSFSFLFLHGCLSFLSSSRSARALYEQQRLGNFFLTGIRYYTHEIFCFGVLSFGYSIPGPKT